MTSDAYSSPFDTEFNIGEARYDRRIVVFYDILGWREHIRRAGNDPVRLQQMLLMILMAAIFEKRDVNIDHTQSAHLSTFSDNVVVSVPYDADILADMISSVARIQLGSAMAGFYLRGAITVGDLYHSDVAVFGPALVRAYELESQVAVFPRFVIDRDVPELRTVHGLIVAEQEGISFINPWHSELLNEFLTNQRDVSDQMAALGRELGQPLPDVSGLSISGRDAMHLFLDRLRQEMAQPLTDSAREKLAWLHANVANCLGVGLRDNELRQTEL